MSKLYSSGTRTRSFCLALVLAVATVATGQTWTSDPTTGTAAVRGGGLANDLCVDAIDVKVPFITGNIDFPAATPDIDVSCNSPDSTGTDYGFWYTYTPEYDCDAEIVLGAWDIPDTVIAVFTGPDCNTLTEVACVHDDNLYHPFSAGVKYWILIGMWEDKSPNTTLSVVIQCAGGACCVAETCTMETPTTCDAQGGTYAGNDVYCDANLCLTGACCYPDGTCTITTAADCATTGGTYSGGSSTCWPNYCPQPAPENDLCTAATEVTAVPFADLDVNLSLATPDIDMSCDNPDCTQTGYGVWYTYTPASSGDMTINTDGTPFDEAVAFALFTGSNCNALIEVACFDGPRFTYPVTAGVKYWILIGLTKCYSVPSNNLHVYIDNVGGACCVDQNCVMTGPTGCDNVGGIYAGDNVPCTTELCLTGACCFMDGSCQLASIYDCETLGGTYLGGSTVCDPNPCSVSGDVCENPLLIELPLQLDYTDAHQTTCGRGDDYWNTCLYPYDFGEDILYQVTVTAPVCVDVTVTGNDPNDSFFGIAFDDVCPPSKSCFAGDITEGNQISIPGLLLYPGTYYIMVDSWPPPDCLTDFTLTITNSPECGYGACCDPKNGCYETYAEVCIASGGAFAGPGTTCDPTDCQGNGVPDVCDIAFGYSLDCQGNGVPDECDLAAGTSVDGDLNGIPDECDLDCNGNGVPDACELPGGCQTGNCGTLYAALCGTGQDCQQNGLLDDCEIVGAVPGIDYAYDDGVQEGCIGIPTGTYLLALSKYTTVADAGMITALSVVWGNVSDGLPVTAYVWADPTQDGNPADAYVIAQGTAVTTHGLENIFNAIPLDAPVVVGPPGTIFFVGISLYSNEFPVAADYTGHTPSTHWLVGNSKDPVDPNDLGNPNYYPALSTLEANGFYGDLMIHAHGVPIADCNGNGTLDACDVPPVCLDGPPLCSSDCNGNLMPDECELAYFDCNGTGIPDDCDIAAGVSADCNGNGSPDECDLANCDGSPWCSDCNNNGILDTCDITNCDGDPACSDCNQNGIPDACDIADCKGELWCNDCQPDGIPDGCQLESDKSRDVLLLEDFENYLFPPVGWTAIITNPYTWEIWSSGAYEGKNYGLCQYDSTYSGVQDEWLISPSLYARGPLTLSGYTYGNLYFGLPPKDNYDVEVWVVLGANVNDGDDVLIGKLDDAWMKDNVWTQFTMDFVAPTTAFRIAFRYHGYDGAAAGIDLVSLEGQPGAPANDCNRNGIPDECDIASGFSTDLNNNGVPDECDPPPCRGDANCDGFVDFRDINSFVDAILQQVFCDGTGANADVTGDKPIHVGSEDINPFVRLLTTNPLPIPCP